MASQPQSGSYAASVLNGKASTQKSMFPKKDQAVVVPVVDEATNQDYLIALEHYVSPTKIIFASRMSNGRFCVYFDSKETAESFITENSEITVKDKIVKVRPLIIPSKKLLISNVNPCIPHSIIENELIHTLGLKLTSSLSFVKGSYTCTRFQHVLSFRRSVYFIADNDNESTSMYIPDTVVIKYDNEDYRIFLTTETNMKCFTCKNTGHIAKNCPNSETGFEPNPTVNSKTNKREAPSTISDTYAVATLVDSHIDSDSSDITPKEGDASETSVNGKSPKSKKKRKISVTKKTSYNASDLNIIKNRIKLLRETGHIKIPLDCDKFMELLSVIQNSSDKIGDTIRYTKDLRNLIAVIEEIKQEVGCYTKSSLTSYLKHLKKEFEKQEGMSTDG